ncbi:MAG: hypothetical protein HFF19_05285 [Oscillospiraceae bacterium]|jgi:hypothetical protein|nr:hypothetical protein [Oscillospiraceae bacterium]
MSELEEKLEGILGNPQAMAQIMSLAQSLNSGGAAQQSNSEPPPDGQPSSAPAPSPPSSPEAQPSSSAAAPSLGGLGGLLGGLNSLDPQMLSAAANLMGQFTSGEDDKRTALLTALRPFVKEQRYAKLDKAIQIAKLSRLIRSGLDLLHARKEKDGHV